MPESLSHAPLDRAAVRMAADRIAGRVHRTPVLTSATLNAQLGCTVFLKAENQQRAGAFKIRGAMNALLSLADDVRRRGVVAFSSGNHAQAVALAAHELGVPATIVMPSDAPAAKAAATRGYGATVVTYDRYTEDRAEIAGSIAAESGAVVLPPFDHPDIIAGQGTAAWELIDAVGRVDAVIAPLGGGGLLAGTTLAVDDRSGCAVFGVEPAAGDDVVRSLAAGRPVTIATPSTIADGAQTTRVGDHTFPIIAQRVAGVWTVEDEALVAEMRFLAERLKQVVEPTGCLGLAGLRAHADQFTGQRVGVILSGGNVDLARFAALIGEPSPPGPGTNPGGPGRL